MKPSEKPIERVDQFFKNKLDDHAIAPSENTWAKVEAGISKKNNVVLWRLAAAVLLMGALVSVIYYSQRGTEPLQPTIAKKKIESQKTINKQVEQANPSISKREDHPPVAVAENSVKKTTTTHQSVQQPVIKLNEAKKEQIVALVEEKKQAVETNVEEKIKVEATTKTVVASTQQKPIKLEFTLEDLPSEETVATTNEVKNTGFKKVLELAREIKQGEGPLNNLKEKKNELFAHNFITGKERKQ